MITWIELNWISSVITSRLNFVWGFSIINVILPQHEPLLLLWAVKILCKAFSCSSVFGKVYHKEVKIRSLVINNACSENPSVTLHSKPKLFSSPTWLREPLETVDLDMSNKDVGLLGRPNELNSIFSSQIELPVNMMDLQYKNTAIWQRMLLIPFQLNSSRAGMSQPCWLL